MSSPSARGLAIVQCKHFFPAERAADRTADRPTNLQAYPSRVTQAPGPVSGDRARQRVALTTVSAGLPLR